MEVTPCVRVVGVGVLATVELKLFHARPRWCAYQQGCSQLRTNVAIFQRLVMWPRVLLPAQVEEEVVEVEVYVPPPDSTPPVMTLLGDGQLASTSEGVLIMIEEVLVQSTWEHAGVTAFDDKDGNITSKASSHRGRAICPGPAPWLGLVALLNRDLSGSMQCRMIYK